MGSCRFLGLVRQSFGLVALSASSRAKTDVFNLRPIDYTVNSTRNNLYYDTTTTPFHAMAGAPGSSYDSDSWEPREEDKGVVARAAFYMATRYDGTDADVPDLELSDTPDAATYRFGKLSTLLACTATTDRRVLARIGAEITGVRGNQRAESAQSGASARAGRIVPASRESATSVGWAPRSGQISDRVDRFVSQMIQMDLKHLRRRYLFQFIGCPMRRQSQLGR